jgi:hypothetical protein
MRSKSNKTDKKITRGKAIVSSDVKDYSNEPFFLEKAERSKKIMEKYGLPKELTVNKK